MKTESDPAVELLNEHIAALPDPDMGYLNFVPFLQDTDLAKALKLKMSKAIVRVFRDNGYPMDKDAVEAPPAISRDIVIQCRLCSKVLLRTHVNEDGTASVPAAAIIASFSRLETECPHDEVTPQMQRRRIEAAVMAAQAAEGKQ